MKPAIVGFLCGVALLGYSTQFDIVPSQLDSNQPTFAFLKKGSELSSGDVGRIEIKQFSVVGRTLGKWDYKNPMWSFELAPGKSLEVSRVQYGVTPAGFAETVKAKPLSMNTEYMAVGFGPGSGGEVEFKLRP